MLTRFFAWNRSACLKIERALPTSFTRHLHTSYKYLVGEQMNSGKALTVLDVGGGKECPYLPFVTAPWLHTVVALDISERELRQNRASILKVVADAASADLPIAAGSVDLLTSRSVIEHLKDNAAFMRSCSRVLREGGCAVHTFPGRFAPFALANALLPNRLARALLYYFQPDWRDECGFKVFYDRCSYHEMMGVIESAGLEVVHCELRYYQAIYCSFFVPLYLLMVGYDFLARATGLKSLSSQILIVARKPLCNADAKSGAGRRLSDAAGPTAHAPSSGGRSGCDAIHACGTYRRQAGGARLDAV